MFSWDIWYGLFKRVLLYGGFALIYFGFQHMFEAENYLPHGGPTLEDRMIRMEEFKRLEEGMTDAAGEGMFMVVAGGLAAFVSVALNRELWRL